jgi:hypothetical protein
MGFFGNYSEVRDGIRVIAQPSFFEWSTAYTLWVPESSCVSEIYAIARCLRQVKYTRPFLGELSNIPFLVGLRQQGPTEILSDCQAAITISSGKHPGRFKGTKHLERRMFASQMAVEIGQIKFVHVPSDMNIADVQATYKDKQNFIKMRNGLAGHEFAATKIPVKRELGGADIKH